MSVLAILEQRAGAWSRTSMETLAAAQQIAAELGVPASAAVIGAGAGPLASELAGMDLETAWRVEHELLAAYSPDGHAIALRQLAQATGARLILFPHSYQVRDFLPELAASLGRSAVCDVIAHRVSGSGVALIRQLLRGKLHSEVSLSGEGPHLASLQAGAYRADLVRTGCAAVRTFEPVLAVQQIRTSPGEVFRMALSTVDLSAAEIIVAVGRGIQDAANIPLARELAEALGGELAASRPICDAGWLPIERQVGSSGQTVAPKLYVALGISGAIQHLIGMRGSGTIVAVNNDPEAPIFDVADYGIAGDLFQVAPELISAVRNLK
jgi:electron transfer flavoprotein alpha subunit